MLSLLTQPLIGAFVAWLLFLVLTGWWARRQGRRAIGWMTLAGWLGLPFYNAWVMADCPGDCAIRVDLLVLLPALVALNVRAPETKARILRELRVGAPSISSMVPQKEVLCGEAVMRRHTEEVIAA